MESLHWVFLYDAYIKAEARKLSFASHNIVGLQLRNGMDLIPSEPLLASAGTATSRSTLGTTTVLGETNQLLIETYKAWNKMHDPLSDGAINLFNYNIDHCYLKATGPAGAAVFKPANLSDFILSQHYLGRCQYGLSLVGEELGQNKTIVSGKKTVLPFDLNFTG